MAEQSRGGKLDGVVGCGMAFGDEVGDEFDLDGVGWHVIKELLCSVAALVDRDAGGAAVVIVKFEASEDIFWS